MLVKGLVASEVAIHDSVAVPGHSQWRQVGESKSRTVERDAHRLPDMAAVSHRILIPALSRELCVWNLSVLGSNFVRIFREAYDDQVLGILGEIIQ